MSTSFLSVPTGTTSAPIFVTPLTNVIFGPSVLGGTATLSFSPSLSIPISSWGVFQSSTASGCFRPATTGYVIVSSATSAANVFIADIGPGLSAGGGTIVSVCSSLASASTTSEVVLASWKTGPGYLQPGWRMNIRGNVSLSNNANVKTLILRASGLAGTALATSPSIASALNYSFSTVLVGRGDGTTIMGTGVLASQTSAQGGLGISTTANPTLASRDYVNQETEFVLTATKATAGDTFQIENLLVDYAT